MISPQSQFGTSPLRLLFCGTPQFAVPTLQHLLAQSDFEIAAVITQPDRPRGRGRELAFSPVKQIALAANLKLFQPEKIRTPESEAFLREANPDAVVIIAYGQIIPARLLAIPKLGWINSHASLLPKYRGAAPIQWAIANGDASTGVTTMRIDAGMDTGDILLHRQISIAPTETAPELAARLAALSAPLTTETLRALRSGTLSAIPQDHPKASLAPLLKKEDGRIDWSLPARTIYNRIRAFTPWPGAYTTFRGSTHQLFAEPACVADSTAQTATSSTDTSTCAFVSGMADQLHSGPGRIHVEGYNLLVSCGQKTLLRLTRVKPEGRKEVSALEFANGAHLQPGETFS